MPSTSRPAQAQRRAAPVSTGKFASRAGVWFVGAVPGGAAAATAVGAVLTGATKGCGATAGAMAVGDATGPGIAAGAIAAPGTAREIAADLKAGKRVLVTCRMGRNRSGFVAALALRLLGVPATDALRVVRSRRKDALGVRAISNPEFQRLLLRT